MKVVVRLFASLREQMDWADATVDLAEGATVADAWRAISKGNTLPDGVLTAVNQEYRTMETTLADGDEVAFFPPVTGG